MPVLKQNTDASMGIQGTDLDDGAFVFCDFQWNPNSLDSSFYVAPRRMIVKGIYARVDAAGTDAGAVTAAIKRAASGTAISAGTALHSGTINLKGTANTNQAITLSTTAADLDIPAGTAIGIDFTGVMTAATGSVTVAMAPA